MLLQHHEVRVLVRRETECHRLLRAKEEGEEEVAIRNRLLSEQGREPVALERQGACKSASHSFINPFVLSVSQSVSE